MAKHGDLRVWWIPQVPMKAFEIECATLVEAKLLMDALGDYDLFQLENRIKPDFANMGGVSIFDAGDDTDGPDGSWVDWCDELGCPLEDYELSDLRQATPEQGCLSWPVGVKAGE